jgi:ribosomal-protein-alanine N-acetyltransferase
MHESDLDAVLLIERAAYEFPWTRGNFLDSLRAGYEMQLLQAPGEPTTGPSGYCVAMAGVDEMHLLNLAVLPVLEGRGHGRFMLDALCEQTRRRGLGLLWLEVRVSNARARALYERYGFRTVGLRRRYYPAHAGTREDAVVMRLHLDPPGSGGETP